MPERKDLDDPSLQLAGRLTRVASQAQRWSVQGTQKLEDSTLTYSQVLVLFQIREGRTTPGEIARRLDVTPKAITKTVDILVAQGYLRRTHDTEDRRKVRLLLSESGRQASEDVEIRVLEPMAHCLDALSDADRVLLKKGLDVIESVMASIHG